MTHYGLVAGRACPRAGRGHRAVPARAAARERRDDCHLHRRAELRGIGEPAKTDGCLALVQTLQVQLSSSDATFQSSALAWVGTGAAENGGVNSETTSWM